MTREQAVNRARAELNLHGLFDWGVRLDLNLESGWLGKCDYPEKVIRLNGHHIDIHPEEEIVDTILHEVAHVLCPNEGHNDVWSAKAKAIGAKPYPCSNLTFPSSVIDAIRNGHEVKASFEEKIVKHTVEETIKIPKYEITRLQDKCKICNKVLVEKSSFTATMPYPTADKKFITYECGHTLIKNISKGTPFHLLISDEDGSCEHQFDKNICQLCHKFRPFDFQIEGMRFAEQAITVHKGVAILDQMGLGKTIQALGLIKFHPELWPVIYIVKSGIKFQWFKQILTWLGTEHLCQIVNSSNDYLIPNLKGYIVGYDMLVPKVKQRGHKTIHQGFDIQKFIERGCKTIVLDECQQIMNPDSTRTQQVRKLAKDMTVIGLSGTPWKNRGSEFFSILNMIAPTLFPSYEGYKRKWVSYYSDPDSGKMKEGGIADPLRFKDYISGIAIRRERTEVMKELPIISRMKLHCQLDKVSERTYDDEVSEFVKWYNGYVIDGTEDSISGINILAKMSRMRHITGLAKIPTTIEFVSEFIEETDRKLCVFVHHQDVGQILFDTLRANHKDVLVLQLTSAMSGEERFKTQELFNNTEKCILIASTLAAGEGLNLQTCSDCVIHERQWNPANEEQAEGRFIRIGQESDAVTASYAEAEDSIDSLFDGIVERKRIQFYSTMSNDEAPQWNQGDIAKELAQAIVKRHREKNRK